jgi:hypothetical protein
MNETPFFKTRMGQVFFERTMPELVKQLVRLNMTLERLADLCAQILHNDNKGPKTQAKSSD